MRAVLCSAFFLASVVFGEIPTAPGWYEIPDTRIDDVCPCSTGYENICGAEGCSGITADWSGGFFDTRRNRLIVWGGGHNGYYGNELYAMELDALRMMRLTEPAPPIHSCSPASANCYCDWAGCGCAEALAGGTQPNSRHTYDGLIYMPNVDKMYAYGGSLACPIGYGSVFTWTFDFSAMTWIRVTGDTIVPARNYGVMCDYDPNTEKVYMHDLLYFYSFDPLTGRYTRLSGRHWGVDYHLTGVIDPKRKKFLMIGNNQQWIIDIGAGSNYSLQQLGSTGGSAVVRDGYPGLAYDIRRDRITAWSGGSTVYSLNMDTGQWSAEASYPGGPGTAIAAGTYKRWSYSPAMDLFVLVNRTNQNAHTFRFPGSTPVKRMPNRDTGIHVKILPNPFMETVKINYELQIADYESKDISLAIYDINGKRIADFTEKIHNSSFVICNSISWNASGLPAGIYVLKARLPGRTLTRRLFLQK